MGNADENPQFVSCRHSAFRDPHTEFEIIMSETIKKIKKDFHAALSMDPAATSRLEVALTYAGFHALLFYRVGHWIWKKRVESGIGKRNFQPAGGCRIHGERRLKIVSYF